VIILKLEKSVESTSKQTFYAISYQKTHNMRKTITDALYRLVDDLPSDREKFELSKSSTDAFRQIVEIIFSNLAKGKTVIISLSDREIYGVNPKEIKIKKPTK